MKANDNQKLREALENITLHFCKTCPNNGPDGCELSEAEGYFEFLCHKLKKARAVLSAPPRNCDVGTASEQVARMKAYCKSHSFFDDLTGCSYNCEGCSGIDIDECALIWAQMPYEEGTNNEQK